MKEIAPKLWIGSQSDFEELDPFGTEWAIVHACKEPHHRQALGYTGRAAPKEHPEYLFAKRGKRLILNLIDADDPKYVPKDVIDAAVGHIRDSIKAGEFVLCHCNQGASRSPTIGLLYLAPEMPEDFEQAEAKFRDLYPAYAPAEGMRKFAREHWQAYRTRAEPKAPERDRLDVISDRLDAIEALLAKIELEFATRKSNVQS